MYTHGEADPDGGGTWLLAIWQAVLDDADFICLIPHPCTAATSGGTAGGCTARCCQRSAAAGTCS